MNDKTPITNYRAKKIAYQTLAMAGQKYIESSDIIQYLHQKGYDQDDIFFIIAESENILKYMNKIGHLVDRPQLSTLEETKLKAQIDGNKRLTAIWESPTLRESIKAEFWLQERLTELGRSFVEIGIIMKGIAMFWEENLSDVDSLWEKAVDIVDKYKKGENPAKEFVVQLYGTIGLQFFDFGQNMQNGGPIF
jgi:hypothetical protein